MGWEDVDRSFDHARPEDIIIHLDLSHFGELVGRVCSETHRYNDLEQFDPHGPEAAHIVVDAWRYACHMADRAEFIKTTQPDLERLAEESLAPQSSTHLPEFGGAAQLPHAPKELERRPEPPV